jgi:acetyltransferase-like isoleucine patch superfamily enzyme
MRDHRRNHANMPRSIGRRPKLLNFRLKLNPIRSLRFAVCRLMGRLALQRAGVVLGPKLSAIGVPVVELHPGSEIRLGAEVMLISSSFATALGINHPVVLRTLSAGASIRIGNRVGISGGSICAANLIEIGDDTMLGANVTIADTDFHPLQTGIRKLREHPSIGVAKVIIGREVFIGTNAMVLKGVSIGDRAVIGAGSVVTRDIPEDAVAAGNPCRIRRMLHSEKSTDPGARSAPVE